MKNVRIEAKPYDWVKHFGEFFPMKNEGRLEYETQYTDELDRAFTKEDRFYWE